MSQISLDKCVNRSVVVPLRTLDQIIDHADECPYHAHDLRRFFARVAERQNLLAARAMTLPTIHYVK